MGSVDWTAAEWASWDPRWSEQQWAEFLGDSLDVPHEEEAPPPPPPAAAEQRKRGPDALGEAESGRPASVPRTVGPGPHVPATPGPGTGPAAVAPPAVAPPAVPPQAMAGGALL